MGSYFVRYLNPQWGLVELRAVLQGRLIGEIKSFKNIKGCIDEVRELILNDLVFERKFYHEKTILLKCLENPKDKREYLIRLKATTENILKKIEEAYLKQVLELLYNEVREDKFQNIDHLISSLASGLINKGFSFEYLYSLKKTFLKKGVSFAYSGSNRTPNPLLTEQ